MEQPNFIVNYIQAGDNQSLPWIILITTPQLAWGDHHRSAPRNGATPKDFIGHGSRLQICAAGSNVTWVAALRRSPVTAIYAMVLLGDIHKVNIVDNGHKHAYQTQLW